MSFGTLLKNIREKYDLKQETVGEIIGVKKAAISGYEQDRSRPNYNAFIKLCNYFQVDANYFMKDDLMHLHNNTKLKKIISAYDNLDEHDKNIIDYILFHKTNYISTNTTIYRFPIYEDQQAAAGAGIYGRDSNFQMEDIICDNIPDKAVFGLKIKGDSMEPEIPDGSTVLLNPNISLEEVINKNIVASIEGEVVCKRFTVENNMYCFSSLNPDRQNMNRKTNDINFKIIGEIVKVI